MTETFCARAAQLAGLAGRLLGWRPAEFWEATPAELGAILLPAREAADTSVSRADLTRMMEQDDG